MFLKAISLEGFKSFPDPQHISFQPGITNIVGPNGCGKSNVTDAVRWVLGEQSAKSLRGDKMEDVIFNGTANRNRMSFAEVSIHFDNQDRRLPMQADQVVITRRYYRSGDSEYLINQQVCRLKDVRELLADTGIGKDGYSVIEQGRVDDILSSHSQARRKIFDEAAGIVKYKMRKTEAEQKLERTDRDWQRLEDIGREMDRRLKPLARQAEEANAYEALAHELRDLDVFFTIKDIAKEEMAAQATAANMRSLDQDLTAAEVAEAKLRDKRAVLRSQVIEEAQAAKALEQLFQEKSRNLATLTEEHVLTNERLRQAGQRFKEIEEEKAALNQASGNLQEKVQEREAHRARLLAKAAEYQKKLTALEAMFATKQAALDAQNQAHQARLDEVQTLRENLFQDRSQLFAWKKDIEHIQEQAAEYDQQWRDWQDKVEDRTATLEQLHQTKEAMEHRQQELQVQVRQLQEKLHTQQEQLTRLDTSLSRLATTREQNAYRLQTLKKWEVEREGYHQAVRAISQEATRDPAFAEGLFGPVAEIIEVDKRYETAVEMALGCAIHNLVTDRADTAARFIAWLKQESAGRETFLPLDQIQARTLPEQDYRRARQCRGFLGCLAEFMTCPVSPELLPAYLGGRILLAEDLDRARELARHLELRYKVVSLEGDVVNPGGSMTGGRKWQGLSGLLGRSQDIAQLETALVKLAEDRQETEKQREAGLREKNDLAAQLQQVQEEAKNLQIHLAESLSAKTQTEQVLEEYQKIQAKMQSDHEALSGKLQERQAQVATQTLKIEDWEKQLRVLEAQIDQEQTDATDLQDLENLRQDIMSVKVSLGTVQEAGKGIENLKKELIAEDQERQHRLQQLAQEKRDLMRQQSDWQDQVKRSREAKSELEAGLEQLQVQRQQLQETGSQKQDADQRLLQELEQARDKISRLEREKDRYQQACEHREEKLTQAKNHIWEEYRLSYRQAKDLAQSLELPEKSRKNLPILKAKMREMPAVNHSAPQDYAELKARYELLNQQKQDIVKTRGQLTRVIDELADAMRRQFAESLEGINEEFQVCFRELFSGGRATLAPAEGDLLDCDIEIKAQPPGKRLQSLRLLSGGEKALTAIALLFAIFRQRPAPFCILDEVDSALDEGNVLRFADFIKKYASSTQFILITHRKGTMESAQRLYGVTMKERGVSGIYSLQLEEGKQYAQA